MRRNRLLIFVTAAATVLSGAFLFTGTGVEAETASPEIQAEGWYWRGKVEDPQVVIPCEIAGQPVTVPNQGCGPVSPADSPAPTSEPTGHYVVSSSGGDATDKTETGGDTGWAAFQWETLDYVGATVNKFVVTLTQGQVNSSRNRGDTWQPGQPIFIQACNVLEYWSAEPGPNAWEARPTASLDCVVPTITDRKFTFDLTAMANTWTEGTGYGFVIRPGTPQKKTELEPFQITFSGYYDPTATAATKPKVTFEYTPAFDDELSGGGGFDDFGGDEFFEEISTGPEGGTLEAVADLDVIPTDAGSEPLPEDAATAQETAAGPLVRGRTRPISSDTPFPWIVLLLLPLAALAFWGTGTALGPVGDPVPARRGGVSRVLAERQAAHRGSYPETRN